MYIMKDTVTYQNTKQPDKNDSHYKLEYIKKICQTSAYAKYETHKL